MSTNTTTTTTDASAEDRIRVQGIKDDNGGCRRSTTEPVDSQRKWSVYFPCFQVINSNTVLYLSSHCIVLMLFYHINFYLFAA